MNYSKNRSISKKIAKSTLWISMVAILAPIILYYSQYKDKGLHPAIEFPNKIGMIAPLVLFFIYIALLISALKNKFERSDLNLLFSLSAVILSFYLILLYSRIFVI